MDQDTARKMATLFFYDLQEAGNAETPNTTTTIGAQHRNGIRWDDPDKASSSGMTSDVGTTSTTATRFSTWIMVGHSNRLIFGLTANYSHTSVKWQVTS